MIEPVIEIKVGRERKRSLSVREWQVALLLACGFRQKEIAAQLGADFHTVSHHWTNIRAKLGIESVQALAVLAHKQGLIELHRGVELRPTESLTSRQHDARATMVNSGNRIEARSAMNAPPKPPPGRIIKERGGDSFCELCGSTNKRAWFGFGKVLGCIQPECDNWVGWRAMRWTE